MSRKDGNNPFGPTLEVNSSLLHGGVDVSRLYSILSTSTTPFDVSRISLPEDGDGLPLMANFLFSALNVLLNLL